MTISWYQCEKCETLIKNDSTPKSPGCPKGHQHDWNKLAEVGDKNYLCKKCGATIQANSSPKAPGCPRGHQHDWRKL